MTRTRVIALLVPLLLAGCTAKRNPASLSAADSTRGGDSAAIVLQAAPVGHILTYEERQGSVLYAKYCAVCHGKEGKGDGFNAFNLDPRPRDFSDSAYMVALSDGQIIQTITGGGRSVNKSPLMPAWGGRMNKLEIEYVIEYVKDTEAQH